MIDDFDMISKKHYETLKMSNILLKCVDIIQKRIIVNNDEIQEMINYFQEIEEYVICAKLKNELK